jgi:hypothetical protein
VLGLDGFCYRGETCELCLVLATGVRPVSFVCSGYRGETCKPLDLGYSSVTEVQCHTTVALCVKLDPGTYKGMHSDLA